jgi:hypothetical protein
MENNNEEETLYDAGFPFVILLGVLSLSTILITFGESACWEMIAERQAKAS